MKSSTVPPDVSYINNLFSPGTPFEASTTRSSLQMRARRSPTLGSGPISLNDHIRNREFYWFTTDWNVTVNNNTINTINDINVVIIANHVDGKSISRNTSFNSITSGGSLQTSFSPLSFGSSSMIMDSSNNPNLKFTVDYIGGGSFAGIFFDWGGNLLQNSSGQSILSTNTRALSTWGTNGGVNVTVDIFDENIL